MNQHQEPDWQKQAQAEVAPCARTGHMHCCGSSYPGLASDLDRVNSDYEVSDIAGGTLHKATVSSSKYIAE